MCQCSVWLLKPLSVEDFQLLAGSVSIVCLALENVVYRGFQLIA